MNDPLYQTQPQASQFSPPQPKNTPAAGSRAASEKELQQAIVGSNTVLAKADTTLTLFPDTLCVDRAKVTLSKRLFFRAAEVVSMRIEDILNVTATLGPFFGTIKIVSRVMNDEEPITVGKFWRTDAIRLKRIIQGYVIALQRNIDCSVLPTKELADQLYQLGEDQQTA